MTIAESLKRFRTSRGLTFGSAAAAFGKARTAWYSYEKGNAIPPVTAIIAVAREFGGARKANFSTVRKFCVD